MPRQWEYSQLEGWLVLAWTHQDPWLEDGPTLMKLAQQEAQLQINDNGEDDCAKGTNSRTVGVNCDCC
jgi:hypothetical protein